MARHPKYAVAYVDRLGNELPQVGKTYTNKRAAEKEARRLRRVYSSSKFVVIEL